MHLNGIKLYLIATDLATSKCDVIAANDGISNHEWHNVRTSSPSPLYCNSNMCQGHGIITHSNLKDIEIYENEKSAIMHCQKN